MFRNFFRFFESSEEEIYKTIGNKPDYGICMNFSQQLKGDWKNDENYSNSISEGIIFNHKGKTVSSQKYSSQK